MAAAPKSKEAARLPVTASPIGFRRTSGEDFDMDVVDVQSLGLRLLFLPMIALSLPPAEAGPSPYGLR